MSDFLSTKSTMADVKRKPGWPTKDEVTLAQSSGYLYGDKAEGTLAQGGRMKIVPSTKIAMKELNKKGGPEFDETTSPLTEEQRDQLFTAKLAADKSPVAALGFDLAKMQYTPAGAGGPLTASGAYARSKDVAWIDGSSKSVAVHESIHRGLNELRKSVGADKVREAMTDKDGHVWDEEILTRATMQRHFGDVETEDKGNIDQISRGKNLATRYGYVLDAVEKLAQEEIKKRKPMGPR